MSDHTQTQAAPTMEVAGILAEYDTPKAVFHAAEAVRDAGFTKWDVHTPYPIHGMDGAMGLKNTPLGWISLAGGITGGSLALLMQWWMNGYDYPLNIGGKPAFAVQTCVPVTFELTILLTAFATLFGMLGLNRLPQLYHWCFGSEKFLRVTDDRFFISIEKDDPKFDQDRTRALLEKTHPLGIELVEEEQMSAAGRDALRENVGLTVEAIVGITSPLKTDKAKAHGSLVEPKAGEELPKAEGLDEQPAEKSTEEPSETAKEIAAEQKDDSSAKAEETPAEAAKPGEDSDESTRIAKYSDEDIERMRKDLAADDKKPEGDDK